MNKLMKFLSGKRILAEVDSKYNGHISVVYDLAWGPHILVEGITQSGGVVDMVWKNTFKQVKRQKLEVKNVLLLGLGGGTTAKIVHSLYPEAKIVGVDIDEKFVELGKKYLDLRGVPVEVHIIDALEFVKREKKKYDLVIVDIYRGRSMPEQFTTQEFAKLSKKLINTEGLIIFNWLYYGEKRKEAVKFLTKLEKEYQTVDPFYPEANVMFFCKK